jgi:hypothetical protein
MTTSTETTTTRTPRNARKQPAPRPELVGLEPSHAEIAIAEAQAAVEEPAAGVAEVAAPIDPAIAELIAKEEAKAAKEEKAAAARRLRIEAYKTGQPIPPVGGKGLPPVVKMNELGALARQLHRAFELLGSDDAKALVDGKTPVARAEAVETIGQLRDAAIARWLLQHGERVKANAADNDTLHPLGLDFDGEGNVRLVEKPKAK